MMEAKLAAACEMMLAPAISSKRMLGVDGAARELLWDATVVQDASETRLDKAAGVRECCRLCGARDGGDAWRMRQPVPLRP
jgi:hypothetical protein